MSYIEQNLNPGESILYQTRLHWIVLVAPFTIAALLGLFGLLGLLAGDSSTAVGVLVLLFIAALAAGFGILRRSSTEMAVTNKRVIIKTGIISKRTLELFLMKIESVGVEQGLSGRLFGYGSIVVRGTGGTHEPFTKIASPLEFRRHVQQQIERVEEQGRPATAGHYIASGG